MDLSSFNYFVVLSYIWAWTLELCFWLVCLHTWHIDEVPLESYEYNISGIRGGSRGGGGMHPAPPPPPPKIGKKMFFVGIKSWFFHTKYPKFFRASLYLKSWIRPCIYLVHYIKKYCTVIYSHMVYSFHKQLRGLLPGMHNLP